MGEETLSVIQAGVDTVWVLIAAFLVFFMQAVKSNQTPGVEIILDKTR